MSALPSVPSLGKVESVVLILGAAALAYGLYKAYQTGAGIKDSISKTLTDAGNSVASLAHKVGIGNPKLEDLPSNDGYPESGAITRAMNAADQAAVDAPIYDPMSGVVIGNNTFPQSGAQEYSPDPFSVGQRPTDPGPPAIDTAGEGGPF